MRSLSVPNALVDIDVNISVSDSVPKVSHHFVQSGLALIFPHRSSSLQKWCPFGREVWIANSGVEEAVVGFPKPDAAHIKPSKEDPVVHEVEFVGKLIKGTFGGLPKSSILSCVNGKAGKSNPFMNG